MICKQCGAEISFNQDKCDKCGASVNNGIEVSGDKMEDAPSLKDRVYCDKGMKWANFLKYFFLWAQGISGIILGVTQMIGLAIVGKEVYKGYASLFVFDVIYGFYYVICGGLFIYAAYCTIKEKRRTLIFVPLASLLQGITNFLYGIIVASIIWDRYQVLAIEEIWSDSFVLVVCIIFAVINRIYFKNRKEIFVN